jgi:hypothetical protein
MKELTKYTLDDPVNLIYRLFYTVHKKRTVSKVLCFILFTFNILIISSIIETTPFQFRENEKKEQLQNGHTLTNIYNIYYFYSLNNLPDKLEILCYIKIGIYIISMFIVYSILLLTKVNDFLLFQVFSYMIAYLEFGGFLIISIVLSFNPTTINVIIIIFVVINDFIHSNLSSISNINQNDQFYLLTNKLNKSLFYLKYALLLIRTLFLKRNLIFAFILIVSSILVIKFVSSFIYEISNKFLFKLNFLGNVFLIQRFLISCFNLIIFINTKEGDEVYFYEDYHVGVIFSLILYYFIWLKKDEEFYRQYYQLNHNKPMLVSDSTNSIYKHFLLSYLSLNDIKSVNIFDLNNFYGMIINHFFTCTSDSCPFHSFKINKAIFSEIVSEMTIKMSNYLDHLIIHLLKREFKKLNFKLKDKFEFNLITIHYYFLRVHNYERTLISIEILKENTNDILKLFQIQIIKSYVNKSLIKFKNNSETKNKSNLWNKVFEFKKDKVFEKINNRKNKDEIKKKMKLNDYNTEDKISK